MDTGKRRSTSHHLSPDNSPDLHFNLEQKELNSGQIRRAEQSFSLATAMDNLDSLMDSKYMDKISLEVKLEQEGFYTMHEL